MSAIRTGLILLIFCVCALWGNKTLAQEDIAALKYRIKTETGIAKADALNQLAYKLKGTPIHFYSAAKDALDFSQRIDYKEGVYNAYRNYQWFYLRYGHYNPDSVLYYSSLEIQHLEKHNLKDLLANSFSFRGRTFSLIDKYDTALYYQTKALQLFEKTGNEEGKSVAFERIGLVKYMKNEFHDALDYFHKARTLNKKTANDESLAVSNYHIGLANLSLSNYHKAASYIYKALSHFIKVKDTANIWNAYELLGNIQIKIKNYKEALRLHEKALSIRKKAYKTRSLPDSINLAFAYSYNNIAEVLLYQNKLDSAKKLADKSLEIKLNSGSKADNVDIANSYLLKSKVFNAGKQFQRSRENLEKARKYYTKARHDIGIANTFFVEGELLHKQGKRQKAITRIDSALEIGQKAEEKSLQMNAHELLALIFMKTGQKGKASGHYQEYNRLREKVYDKEKMFSLAELRLEKEKQQLEGAMEQKQKELRTQEKRYNITRIVGYIIVFLFLITVAYLLRNKEKQKAVFHKTITKAGKSELIQRMRTEHDTQIIKTNLKDKVDEYTVDKVINDLKLSSKNTFDDDFLMIYHKVEEEFFQKLRKKHPNLTKRDQVLCGMIKMGLVSKQIALITFRTPESIHVARSRLRKKLEMKAKHDLGLYLQNF